MKMPIFHLDCIQIDLKRRKALFTDVIKWMKSKKVSIIMEIIRAE